MQIAAKCAPKEQLFNSIKNSGLSAVELYLSSAIMSDLDGVIRLCKNFSFRYALHAPKDGYAPLKLARLAKAINATTIVFHDIYWEDEWSQLVRAFKNTKVKLCVENTSGVDDPLKFMRRYGLGRCLDLEHLQMQCRGVYEEEFMTVIREAAHIHLTGYIYGSELWHTHLHYNPRHARYLLGLVERSGYRGMVVSEARVSLQTTEEFMKLNRFYQKWNNSLKR